MENPEPVREHRALEKLAGHFAGPERMHPSYWNPDAQKASAVTDGRVMLDGYAVVQDYAQQLEDGTRFAGHGVFRYDMPSDTYELHWFDSTGGPERVFRGGFADNVLVLTSQVGEGWQRLSYDFNLDKGYRFKLETSDDGDRWNLALEGENFVDGKSPQKRAARTNRKTAAKKAPSRTGKKTAKKATGRKAGARKKVAARKTARKVTPKKKAAAKATARGVAKKKAGAGRSKKRVAKKAVAKKATAKKAAARKAAPKKANAKKTTPKKAAAKKATAKKATARKATPKKATPKKAAGKKAAAKKATARKSTPKKAAAKKATAKKATAKKATAKKATAKKATAKKATAKKATAKKATAKKAAARPRVAAVERRRRQGKASKKIHSRKGASPARGNGSAAMRTRVSQQRSKGAAHEGPRMPNLKKTSTRVGWHKTAAKGLRET